MIQISSFSRYTGWYALQFICLILFVSNGVSYGQSEENIAIMCVDDAVQKAPPTLTDACDNTISANPGGPEVTSNLANCSGTVTYTWYYDGCNNETLTHSLIYTISPPTFSIPTDGEKNISCLSEDEKPAAPITIQDACGTDLIPVFEGRTENLNANRCVGTITYSWSYTNCSGDSETYNFVYYLSTSFEIPNDEEENVSCAKEIQQPNPPIVTNNCGEEIIPTGPEITMETTCNGFRTYVWTYVNCNGTTKKWSHKFNIEIPTLPVPTNVAETINCPDQASEPTPPTIMDSCNDEVSPTPDSPIRKEVTNDKGCITSIIYEYKYRDCVGRVRFWKYIYNVLYEDPVIPANEEIKVDCISDIVPKAPPIILDKCDNPLTSGDPDIDESGACLNYVYTETYTYTSCNGKTFEWKRIYKLNPPSFVDFPDNTSKNVSCPDDVKATTPPVVKDNCGNIITPLEPVIGAIPTCEGQTIIQYEYVLCTGESRKWLCTFNIEAPALDIPAKQEKQVSCPDEIIQPTLEKVFDACGNEIVPKIEAPATLNCDGKATYHFEYIGCDGTVYATSFTYILKISPIEDIPDKYVTLVCKNEIQNPQPPTLKDACGRTIIPSGPKIVDSQDYCGGVDYTWIYQDCNGNRQDFTIHYTIEPESTIFPSQTDRVITVDSRDDILAPSPFPLEDFCGNSLTPVRTEESIYNPCPATIFTDTYTDCSGVQASYRYVFMISGGGDYRIEGSLPEDATVSCSDVPDEDDFDFKVYDSNDNELTVKVKTKKFEPENRDCPYNYEMDRIFCVDLCGIEITVHKQRLWVMDMNPPSFQLMDYVTLPCHKPDSLVPPYEIMDNCDTSFHVSHVDMDCFISKESKIINNGSFEIQPLEVKYMDDLTAADLEYVEVDISSNQDLSNSQLLLVNPSGQAIPLIGKVCEINCKDKIYDHTDQYRLRFYPCLENNIAFYNNQFLKADTLNAFKPYGKMEGPLFREGITEGLTYVSCFEEFSGSMNGEWRLIGYKNDSKYGAFLRLNALCIKTTKEHFTNRIWRVADRCGNFCDHAQYIQFYDNQSPIFEAIPDTLFLCEKNFAITNPKISDNCGIASESRHIEPLTHGSEWLDAMKVTWTATDDYGLTNSTSQIIFVKKCMSMDDKIESYEKLPNGMKKTSSKHKNANRSKIRGTDITVYPNPTTGEVLISTLHPIQDIRVMNLQGKIITSQEEGRKNLNLNELEAGIYMLSIRLKDQDTPVIKTIIKK